MQIHTAEFTHHQNDPSDEVSAHSYEKIQKTSIEFYETPVALSQDQKVLGQLKLFGENLLGRCLYDSERVGGHNQDGVAYDNQQLGHHKIKKIKTLKDFESLSVEEKQLYQEMKADPEVSKAEFDERFAALFGVYDGRIGTKVALYLRDKGFDEVIQILQHLRRRELLGVLRPTVPNDLLVETNQNLINVFTAFENIKDTQTGYDAENKHDEVEVAPIGQAYIQSMLASLDYSIRKKIVDYFPTNQAEFLSIYGELAGGLFTPAFGARRNSMNQGLNPTEWDSADKMVINIGLAGIAQVLYAEKLKQSSRMQRLGVGLLMVSGELSREAQPVYKTTPPVNLKNRMKQALIQGAWRLSALRA